LGAIYEIGALCALDEALDGIRFTDLDHYVGVSAGSFIASALANGMGPQELCKSFIDNDQPAAHGVDASDRFDPAWLMRPALGEFARRSIMLPGLLAAAVWRATVQRKSLVSAIELLGPALPTGIFSSDEVHTQLAAMFSKPGRTNDFRQLKSRLTLVATNLNSGEAAPFGQPGWDEVPISLAVQASAALPGLFPPVEINDQYYVDGALKKTLHATVALEEGVDLLLCLNPLVPFDATASNSNTTATASNPKAGATHAMPSVMQRGLSPPEKQRIPSIVDGGLPGVLSQTFRSMIHSRMELGMKHYERTYPSTDIILIEPDRHDPELYLANTFSYGQRRALAEHAYQQTRSMLRSNKTTLSRKLARHGITLNSDVLNDPKRQLVQPPAPTSRLGRAIVTLQEVMNDLDSFTQRALAVG
jgi:NTE family protein